MRNVLIRPHDDHASGLPIDAAHCIDVVTALDVGAEHLLVVVKAVASLPRQKQRRHRLDGELTMSLLKYRTDIDHRVDDGRLPILCEEIA